MDIQSYAYADEAHTRIDELNLVVTKSGNIISLTGDVLATATVGLNGNITLETTIDGSKHEHLIQNITGLEAALNQKIDVSREGVANGIATLNELGLVPSSQLPSYVDDVVEYESKGQFPLVGEGGKIYIDKQAGTIHRWSGSLYISIGSTDADKATTAERLETPRLIELIGDITGSVEFDGSGNIQIVATSAIQEFRYTNTDPMPSAVGGFTAGTTFEDVTLDQMFTNLLYPYQFPSFNNFSMSGESTTKEVGQTLTGGLRNFTFNITNDLNVKANSISIQDLTRNVTLAQDLPNTNTANVNIGDDIIKTSNGSHRFRISGQNTKNQTITRNYQVNWLWRVYYGNSELPSLDAEGIKSLHSSTLSSNPNGTKSYNAGGYKYIAYPTLFGVKSSFRDPDTGFSVAMEPPLTIQITNNFGISTNYFVHRTTNPIVGSIRITVG